MSQPNRPRTLELLVRCAGSSLLAVAVEFALLNLLVAALHIYYLVGSAIASTGYFILNFVVNRRWAFRATHQRALPQLMRHVVVVAGGMALGLPLLWMMVGQIGLPLQLGWPAAGAVSFLLWTFPMNRWFTYRAAVAATA